jgi:hypothetical protein
MPLRRAFLLAAILAVGGCTHARTARVAPLSGMEREAISATAQRWWRVVAARDSAAVRAASVADLHVTLSSGRTYDRDQFLKAVGDFAAGPATSAAWSEIDIRPLGEASVVLTGRSAESSPGGTTDYRYQMVLEREAGSWRMARTQSTRVLALTPRIPLAAAGPTADLVGAYRAPRGGSMHVTERNGALILTDPSGGESRMEPIGPGVFEIDYVTNSSGLVRMVFNRDSQGRVTGLTRLGAASIVTWPRQ